MDQSTRASLKKISFKAKDRCFGPITNITRVNGKKIKWMEKELLNGQMGEFMSENIIRIRNMDLEE